MGDIWPYGPPVYVAWNSAYNQMIGLGQSRYAAQVFAAIAEAESSLDLTVINDTPATGDYSVGCYQVNYYGQLYADRASQFGNPQQLIDSGLYGQSRAAIAIANSQGFSAWSTYDSGAYLQYMHGAPQQPPGTGPGGTGQLVNTQVSPPTGDYSDKIKTAADNVLLAAYGFRAGQAAMNRINDRNPHV